MNKMIAYCGLDCAECEARIATVNNDDALRAKVAAHWSKLNNIEITPEMINCEGCRVDGKKTVFCDSLCEIRQCAMKQGFETCADCGEIRKCGKITMITGNNAKARKNLGLE